MKHHKAWSQVALLVGLCLSMGAARGAELALDSLFRPAALSHVKLSPNGHGLAGLATDGTNECLVTLDLDTRQRQIVLRGDMEDYNWVSDDRLVVMGDGLHTGAILGVNRDGRERKVLVEAIWAQARRNRGSWRTYELLRDGGRNYPEVLVQRTDGDAWDGPQLPTPTVYRLNVLTGRFALVEKNPGRVFKWLADAEGRVRLAVEIERERGRVLYRDDLKQPWRGVIEWGIWEDDVYPLEFHADGTRFYVAARNGHDTLGLYLCDPRQGVGENCLWRHDRYDFGAFLNTEQVSAVLYQGERPQVAWIGSGSTESGRALDGVLPGFVALPVGLSRDGQRTLVCAFSDRHPGLYYVYHREPRKLDFVGDAAPWLRTNELAEMQPLTYRASDDMEIPGYLTLPAGREPRHLPLVVVPHGGPWYRVGWGYDPEVQFLANRGYAVLQPNYRGSTGYGFAFHKAGYRQYGRRIQDDITDAVRWTIAAGIADPKRIAIGGASFGGYAAMTGLIRTPELYRCGFSYCGVTDVRRQLRRQTDRSPKLAQSFARLAVGDYRADRESLEDVSPLNHVAGLQAPVLLAYGGRDPIVDVEQGRLLEKALKKHDKTFEVIYEPNEGHGFHRLSAITNLYCRIEAFLKKHMP